jgi:hypothetical protein
MSKVTPPASPVTKRRTPILADLAGKGECPPELESA